MDSAPHENAVLNAIDPDACLTMDELERVTGLTRRQISNGAARLVQRRYIERVERGCFQLTETGLVARQNGVVLTSGPNGPLMRPRVNKQNTFRARCWRAMRLRGKFTLSDLVALASQDEGGARTNATRYVRLLTQAGYLRELRREKGDALTSNGFKRWSLIRNTGPAAPVPKTDGSEVWDPNTEQVYACDGGRNA